jgi:hypothetical protein
VSVTTRILSRLVDRIIVESRQMVKASGANLRSLPRNPKRSHGGRSGDGGDQGFHWRLQNSGSPMKLRELHFHS